jgi:GntR family transcriptional regulator
MIDSFSIDEHSGVPVWIQVRNHLVFLIKSGKLESGDVMPTVRELANQLGINYNTVHKVYQDLELDGLIVSSRGRRSYVADVSTDAINLPDSPVDLVLGELLDAAKNTNMTKDELRLRFEQKLKDYE